MEEQRNVEEQRNNEGPKKRTSFVMPLAIMAFAGVGVAFLVWLSTK